MFSRLLKRMSHSIASLYHRMHNALTVRPRMTGSGRRVISPTTTNAPSLKAIPIATPSGRVSRLIAPRHQADSSIVRLSKKNNSEERRDGRLEERTKAWPLITVEIAAGLGDSID